jgi:orotate phosphoribosyltransferase
MRVAGDLHAALGSGQVSTSYFDKYLFESDPQLLGQIVDTLVPLVPEVIAGLELGGIAFGEPIVRGHGNSDGVRAEGGEAIWHRQTGRGCRRGRAQVLVVEDVITSGGQVVLSTADLRALGAVIDHVVCVIDREEGGRENLAAVGLNLNAAFTAGELRSAP